MGTDYNGWLCLLGQYVEGFLFLEEMVGIGYKHVRDRDKRFTNGSLLCLAWTDANGNAMFQSYLSKLFKKETG